MNKIARCLSLALAMIMVLSMVACGSKNEPTNDNNLGETNEETVTRTPASIQRLLYHRYCDGRSAQRAV